MENQRLRGIGLRIVLVGGALLMVLSNAIAQSVTVIVPTARSPLGFAVNPVTNKIYVGARGGVTVIDGATNSATILQDAGGVNAIALIPGTNKIYALQANALSVINGADNSVQPVDVGNSANAVAVNPVSNKISAATFVSNTV